MNSDIFKKITSEDISFLEELSNELSTQTTDHNADPVFWGIRDEVQTPPLAEDYGDTYIIWEVEEGHEVYNSKQDNLSYFIQQMQEHDDCYGESLKMSSNKIKEEILEKYQDDPYEFIREHDLEEYYRDGNIDINYELVTSTGAFLTKRAALEHIKMNRHNYKNPHTYAMTAFRNPEFERLISILKKIGDKNEK